MSENHLESRFADCSRKQKTVSQKTVKTFSVTMPLYDKSQSSPQKQVRTLYILDFFSSSQDFVYTFEIYLVPKIIPDYVDPVSK